MRSQEFTQREIEKSYENAPKGRINRSVEKSAPVSASKYNTPDRTNFNSESRPLNKAVSDKYG